MRNINGKSMQEHGKLITTISQVFQPLHFIVGIIHKALIEEWEIIRFPHHHIRLLCIGLEAWDRKQINIVYFHIPVGGEVIMQFITRSEFIAFSFSNTTTKILFGFREEG